MWLWETPSLPSCTRQPTKAHPRRFHQARATLLLSTGVLGDAATQARTHGAGHPGQPQASTKAVNPSTVRTNSTGTAESRP